MSQMSPADKMSDRLVWATHIHPASELRNCVWHHVWILSSVCVGRSRSTLQVCPTCAVCVRRPKHTRARACMAHPGG